MTAPERRLLAACLVAGPAVAAGVRLFGLRRTRDVLARWSGAPTPARSGPEAEACARSVARVAGIASRRGPLPVTCVPRSLLVWWLLRRRGIDAALRVGVSGSGTAFRAHAWVEHDGTPLGEPADATTRFAAFDRDFAARQRTAR